ncbi:putative ER lumen protein-retaining receptor C28H8.4 [Tripterygium wilfordii]|uniref:Putative ER lumen protein-retaining receptor C28H8.4 n=1 Tax=Tripterygium wilfordii TaxID=458696 RepID=A0A7J7D4U1_TRIWF|nr:ER lumen protein-retaining receptor erd-2.2-like [Tripterygium wilfordii]KAF5741289.1 putative ER lumen protein-retaining receptor C28H8.4 [Tripterygium wilfordii]
MGIKENYSPSAVKRVIGWVRGQSKKVKVYLGVMLTLISLAAMVVLGRYGWLVFVGAAAVHAVGILVLTYKLTMYKSCSGLSLKSQELTAIFLTARLVCNFSIGPNIHTGLDIASLLSTAWVIYMIRFRLKATYMKKQDTIAIYYTVVPSIILAILIHPHAFRSNFKQILWAFSVYLEAVSVLPQLRMIQNAKMIEPFTAHYVFALGISRLLSCADWIYQIYLTRGRYFFLIGYGKFWFPMAILSEFIQTFILADFCYYYTKSFMEGQTVMRMPV